MYLNNDYSTFQQMAQKANFQAMLLKLVEQKRSSDKLSELPRELSEVARSVNRDYYAPLGIKEMAFTLFPELTEQVLQTHLGVADPEEKLFWSSLMEFDVMAQSCSMELPEDLIY